MKARWLVQLAVLLGLCSCAAPYWDRRIGPRVKNIDARAKVIKLHMSSGEVFVLSPWRLDVRTGSIAGEGEKRSPARTLLQRGTFEVPLTSVAMFESNHRKDFTSTGVSVSAALGTLTLVLLVSIAASFAGSER